MNTNPIIEQCIKQNLNLPKAFQYRANCTDHTHHATSYADEIFVVIVAFLEQQASQISAVLAGGASDERNLF